MVVAKIKTKQTEHITEDYMYRLKTAGQLCIVSRFPLSCSFPRGFRLLDLIGIGSLDFFTCIYPLCKSGFDEEE
jgi:hypothetical protein